jgi:hypothetical protein
MTDDVLNGRGVVAVIVFWGRLLRRNVSVLSMLRLQARVDNVRRQIAHDGQ